MLICQRNTDLQPNTDSQQDIDWTLASQSYPNVEEAPSFISQQRQAAGEHVFTTSADPQNLQGKQLQVYTAVQQHHDAVNLPPLRMIVSGTAGTGKSYLIHCLRLLLQHQLRVAAPTGVAAFNVDGCTLHSLLSLPTKGDFKDLEGERLNKLQQSFADIKYIIIDEMSMVGRKILGQVDRRLRQAFPHRGQKVFGGCSCLLFGDFGQLPPVMDLPLYTTDSRSELSDQGRAAYHQFNQAVVLNQVMRQAGQDPEQVQFRDILLRLRDAKVTVADWKCLMTQTPTLVQDLSPFANALHLNPTVEAVVEHNVSQLRASSQPIATIKAVHTGANASKAPADDAGGLEAVICLARSARVMLTSNLWVDVGLVNGAMGTIRAICYRSGGPPDLPISVMVHFDNYSGPTLHDGTVPITPLRRTWSSSRGQCSHLQLPLKLAWAVTIHKSQGLTLDKVVIDVGKREFSSGLTFVACSRVRQLKDLLFTPPFPFQRLANLANSQRLRERQEEDVRLLSLHVLPPTDHSIASSSSTLHTPMGFNRPPPPPSSSPLSTPMGLNPPHLPPSSSPLSTPMGLNPPHLPPSSSPLSTPTDCNPPHLPPSSSPLSTPTDRNPPHLPPSSSPLSTPMGLNPPHMPPSSSPLSTPMGLSPPPLPPPSSPISI